MAKPVCVLIGAGEGLGQSLAKKFAAEGFRIVFSSDRMESAEDESATPDVYALYVSQASEIYDQAAQLGEGLLEAVAVGVRLDHRAERHVGAHQLAHSGGIVA